MDSKIDRDKFIQKLREHEIESNFGAYSVHEQFYYRKKYNFQISDFNNSSKCFKQGLALPLHFKLTSEEIEHLKNILVNIMNLDGNDL